MGRKSETDAELEQRIARLLAGTAEFEAPPSLEARILKSIERGAKVPWWQQRVPEWPLLAQLLFLLTGIAAAAALLLSRPAAPRSLGMVISRPAADLHVTLDVLGIFHRLADTIAGALTDGVWYGSLALCAAAYVALFVLIAFGYRFLLTPAATKQTEISR